MGIDSFAVEGGFEPPRGS